MRRVFLDHQSATPLLPGALAAMTPFFGDSFGNAASLHQHGLRARDALAAARARLAALIHAPAPEEIIFTSDGTEAANLAIKGVAWANQKRGGHIVVSATEHPSVMRSVEFLEQHGFTATRVKVDGQGLVHPDDVRAALTEQTILIAVHLVNHDIGAIEPAGEIGRLAAERGIPFFVDAEAAVGWLPVDVTALGASLLSFSPHKFYGPKGVGVLYRHRHARLASLLHGGEQEGGRRAGVENLPAIVGAGVAAEAALRELPQRVTHTAKMQQRLWRGLVQAVPQLRLNGPEPGARRITTNLNLSVAGLEGEGLVLLADLQGVALGSGSGCLTKALKIPPVLAAIGLSPAQAQAAIMLSPGRDTSEADVDYAIEVLAMAARKLRAMSPAWTEEPPPGRKTAG